MSPLRAKPNFARKYHTENSHRCERCGKHSESFINASTCCVKIVRSDTLKKNADAKCRCGRFVPAGFTLSPCYHVQAV